MQTYIDKIRTVAESTAEEHNLKLHDVAFQKEKSDIVLRIMIDGEVTLEKCAEVSRTISAWLDEQSDGFIPFSSYTLEVTSPGIDRPLVTYDDFNSKVGRLCRIQTKVKDETGRGRYKGHILDVTKTHLKIYTDEESAEFTIDLSNIKKAQLEVEL